MTDKEMIEQRRLLAAENKAKMDELAASSPDDHPNGPAEYWREMDELGKQHMAYMGVLSELPEGRQHIRPVDTSKVDITRAVIEQSSPDTRFLLAEDVSFLNFEPNQDK